MKNIILFIWQLPQNILGLLVILFTNAKYNDIDDDKRNNFWITRKFAFGVSLGNYIIFGKRIISKNNIKHEQGHQKQSLYLGWLYLLIIGLPSFCGNIYDRLFHKKWNMEKRIVWYYNQPWEKWADKLGGEYKPEEVEEKE